MTQAQRTFRDMDEALADPNKNLTRLRGLGAFLKDSSAQFGVRKVQHSCEMIEGYGNGHDAINNTNVSTNVAFEHITALVARVKDEFCEAKVWLDEWLQTRDMVT
ncbi:hypothetical protein BKA62DRAFT_710009 [Auriculariales sp. MPI-PUGE-AT-0066]|nr:hypothetical protein BKA62DRAFT_710009 [Auriculariales sp. MPI-PUGE-AT-0066]